MESERPPGMMTPMDERGTSEPSAPTGTTPDERPAQSFIRRPLRRRAGNRLIAGVAGGVADHLGTRPLVFRLVFVVFAFIGGIGLLVYLLLWWLIPREDLPDSAAERLIRRFPDAPSWLGIALLGLGVVLLAGRLGLWDTNVLWAVLLIGLGVVLFRRDTQRATRDGGSVPPAPDETGAAVPPQQPAWAQPTSPLPPVVTRPMAMPRAPREASPLGWLAFGVALLAVGGLAILQNLNAVHVSAVRFPALALLVLGVGLLVGAFIGRARWLILPGLLLVPIVLAASLIDVPLEGGVHEIHAFPQTPQAVAGSYRVAAGSIHLDLTSLEGTAVTPVIGASTGVGKIDVVVPFDAHVVATGKAGVGMVMVGPFSTDRGLDRSLHRAWEPTYGDGPTITLDLQTGVGDIWVYRRHATGKERMEAKAG
jgi:phage shock protein PspC (stress-responsive transcriptional regulator)